MSRRVLPSFFFDETSADEDLMAEQAIAGLDPDALQAAIDGFDNVYDGPGAHEAAIAAAIHAYLDAMGFKDMEALRRELDEASS